VELTKKAGLELSASELCTALGRDNRTITRWKKDGLEVEKRGRANVYTMSAVIKFLGEREYERGKRDGRTDGRLEESTGEAGIDAGEELAKQRFESARKLKMQNDLQEQKLALRAEVDEQARYIGQRFRSRGENLQRRYGDEIGDDLRDLLKMIKEDLEEFLKQ